VIESCDWDHEYVDEYQFMDTLHKTVLSDLFGNALGRIADKFGVDNLLDFEFEYGGRVLLKSKNAYISKILLDENGLSVSEMHYAGIETIKKNTPELVRTIISEFIEILFDGNDDDITSDIVDKMKVGKKMMMFSIPDKMDSICPTAKINGYSHYIKSDGDMTSFEKGASYIIKGAAMYNDTLKKYPYLSKRYSPIVDGDNIRYYYCKSNTDENNVFAYPIGKFPIEFAPDIDIDAHYSKTVLSVVNTLCEVIGLPKINDNISVFDKILRHISSVENRPSNNNIFDDILKLSL